MTDPQNAVQGQIMEPISPVSRESPTNPGEKRPMSPTSGISSVVSVGGKWRKIGDEPPLPQEAVVVNAGRTDEFQGQLIACHQNMPHDPPAPSESMDEDAENGSDSTNWDDWFNSKFSESMKRYSAKFDHFQQQLLETVKVSHEGLRNTMTEKIVTGLQNIGQGVRSQDDGEKREILAAVEGLIKLSTDRIVLT